MQIRAPLMIIIVMTSLTACSKSAEVSEEENKCAIIATVQEQNICYRNLAVAVKSKKICEKIVDQDGTQYKENCLYRVTVELGEEDCTVVSDTQERDLCYMKMAGVKKDKKYCDQISGPPYKEPCEGQFTE